MEMYMIMQIKHFHGFTEGSSRGGNEPNILKKKILISTNLDACFICSYNLYSHEIWHACTSGMSVSAIFFHRDYSIF